MIPLWLTCISISCLQLLHSEPPSIIFCRTPTLALQWPLSKADGPLTCHLASLFSRDVDEFFACVYCRKWLVKASKASILKKIPATLPSRFCYWYVSTFVPTDLWRTFRQDCEGNLHVWQNGVCSKVLLVSLLVDRNAMSNSIAKQSMRAHR